MYFNALMNKLHIYLYNFRAEVVFINKRVVCLYLHLKCISSFIIFCFCFLFKYYEISIILQILDRIRSHKCKYTLYISSLTIYDVYWNY